ncbi:hypothetical protein B4U79_09913 [Dinothrombium tinctorium]|uniref:Uncharacterized protein n=1 Tax=Dinothrombium tinctorium TaxID=1965070 RepID=A0A3S3PTT6_9ACAR|nr:hypothetical protein B4U79_09913 [Dinothrombium tinctorium]
MFSNAAKQLLKSGLVSKRSVRTLYPYYHPWLVTPPAKRIPFAEKVFWGIFFNVGLWSVPLWVLYHLPEYRGLTREEWKAGKGNRGFPREEE